jgi:Polysaccharide pyruvyl transferase
MLKIGILTYSKEYANLGTNMQAYCTLKAIQGAFPAAHAEIIDYSGWKRSKRPYLSSISLHSLKNDFVRMKKYDQFFRSEMLFSKHTLVSSNLREALDFINKQAYDAIFVGSDTVLELRGAHADNLNAYWLDASIRAKKFVLAASCHNVAFEDLSAAQRKKIREAICHFSLLGVRDDATYRLLSQFLPSGDQRLQTIPDPTFTHAIDQEYTRNYLRRKRLRFDKPVVCLHLVRNCPWAGTLAKYFRKQGYTVVSLRPAYYADLVFTDLSPFEQVGLYSHFSLVITHRFHDCVFSLKNLTPVIGFLEHTTDVTSHGESRLRTLFRSVGMDSTHFVADKSMLTAEHLFDLHRGAIKRFVDRAAHTRAVLCQNKIAYESFLERAKALVHN